MKIKLFYIFLLLVTFMKSMAALATANAAIVPISEKEVLEIFFRNLFEESQGGYVLYGVKPICVEGVLQHETNLLMLGDEFHKRNVVLKEGYKIWQKFPCNSNNFFVHFYETPCSGWQHVVLINREEFIKVVRKNLSLFQQILGPEVSPEGLFEKLFDREESFDSVFNDNNVLIGIVLGFGTQNALHVSRREEIEALLAKKEKIPFKPPNLMLKKSKREKNSDFGPRELMPSFGYSSLEEELEHMDKTIFVSKEIVRKSSPLIPWFGCLKSKETEELLKSYTKSQKKIQEVLEDHRFLEKILTRCGEKEVDKMLSSLSSRYINFDNQGGDLSSLVAKSIHQGLPEYEKEWMVSFTRGMRAVENGDSLLSRHEWYDLLDNYRDSKDALESKKNLVQSEEFFSKLIDKSDSICLVPGKLYYKLVKGGKGESITTSSEVVGVDYVIKNCSGKVLCASEAEEIDLSNCITGFTEAVKGMSIGEEREIYIHPALAYGESSQFPPNMALIAEVKLVKILEQGKQEDEQPILTLSLKVENSDQLTLQRKYYDLRDQFAFQLGARTWAHFKKGQNTGYSLEGVIEALQEINQRNPIDLIPEEEELLTRLHWRIYAQTSNDPS